MRVPLSLSLSISLSLSLSLPPFSLSLPSLSLSVCVAICIQMVKTETQTCLILWHHQRSVTLRSHKSSTRFTARWALPFRCARYICAWNQSQIKSVVNEISSLCVCLSHSLTHSHICMHTYTHTPHTHLTHTPFSLLLLSRSVLKMTRTWSLSLVVILSAMSAFIAGLTLGAQTAPFVEKKSKIPNQLWLIHLVFEPQRRKKRS